MTTINVQVVYALAQRQTIETVQLADGSTVRDAIVRSGVLDMHPELTLERCELAIWGKMANLDRALRDRDRVEICSPLLADPKNMRRRRASQKGR